LLFISPFYKLINSHLESVFVCIIFTMTVHLVIIPNASAQRGAAAEKKPGK